MFNFDSNNMSLITKIEMLSMDQIQLTIANKIKDKINNIKKQQFHY